MSTPYLITDFSTKSFSEDIQNSLQKTRNFAEPDYSEGSNSKNSIKYNRHKHSAKINRSKEQCLRIRQKVVPVHEYINKLSDELSDETFKLCKICQNKWAE
ncbi:12394_t:CDS:1, partial [Dentiscutata heterogama]